MCVNFTAYAQTEKDERYTKDYFDKKFEELYPEYKIMFRTPETKQTFDVLPSSHKELRTVTKNEGNDIYSVTLYNDGGYSKFAVAGGSVSFSGGNSSSSGGIINWSNRKAYGNITEAGIFGGFIAEISYSYYSNGVEGWFTGYGSYMNTATINDTCSVLIYRQHEGGGLPARFAVGGETDVRTPVTESTVASAMSISISNGTISGKCDLQKTL